MTKMYATISIKDLLCGIHEDMHELVNLQKRINKVRSDILLKLVEISNMKENIKFDSIIQLYIEQEKLERFLSIFSEGE